MKANGDVEQNTGKVSFDQARALALSAWDLERTRFSRKETSRGRIIHFRTHKRLQAVMEERKEVPPQFRSRFEIQEKSQVACLLIHGTMGGPANLESLAKYLWQGGMTVYVPLLAGHGTPDSAPHKVLWKVCLHDVRQRFRLLKRVCRQVYVVGSGFGGALAIQLARREAVTGLALLAPALVPRVSIFERLFLRLKLHRFRRLRPRMGYLPEILEAMESARTQVPRLRIPIYAAHCEDDDYISPISLRVLQKRARHKECRFRVFDHGGHDILAAHGEKSLNAEILKFFKGQ